MLLFEHVFNIKILMRYFTTFQIFQIRMATFLVLNGHMWLVAIILAIAVLRYSLNPGYHVLREIKTSCFWKPIEARNRGSVKSACRCRIPREDRKHTQQTSSNT